MTRGIDSEAVRLQLARLCQSKEFAETTRAVEFLQFVIEEAQAGRADLLSQRVIASDLYGRSNDFDPSTDPIVRMQATRVRRALEHYYLTTGKHDAILISLQKGSYAPTIEINPTTDADLPTRRLEQPLLLVAPFSCDSTSDPIEHIAEGLASELAITLDRYRRFRIMLLPDTPQNHTSIDESLQHACQNTDCYIINGTVIQRNGSIHISVRLEDICTGILSWSHEGKSNQSTGEMDSFLDEFVKYIASAIAEEQGVIAQHDFPRLKMTSPEIANTYEALLHIYYAERSGTLEQYEKAIMTIRSAIDASPNDGRLWTGLARISAFNYSLELLPDLFVPIENIVEYAHKGLQLGAADQDAWCILSFVETIAGNLQAGREAVLTALSKNPDSLFFRDAVGYLMILQGDWEQGAIISRDAIRSNPHVREITYSGLWLEAFHRGDFEEAYSWSLRYTNKNVFWAHIMEATALIGMGEIERAKHSAEYLLMTRPDFRTSGHRLIRHFIKFEPLAHRIEQSLELSGIPISH